MKVKILEFFEKLRQIIFDREVHDCSSLPIYILPPYKTADWKSIHSNKKDHVYEQKV